MRPGGNPPYPAGNPAETNGNGPGIELGIFWEYETRTAIPAASPNLSLGGGSSRPQPSRAWSMISSVPRLRLNVRGMHLLLRLVPEDTVAIQVHCPRGGVIRYGEVLARGAGIDPGTGVKRALPPRRSIVVFEEDPEGGPGPEVVVANASYRVITLGDVILALIPSKRQYPRGVMGA